MNRKPETRDEEEQLVSAQLSWTNQFTFTKADVDEISFQPEKRKKGRFDRRQANFSCFAPAPSDAQSDIFSSPLSPMYVYYY